MTNKRPAGYRFATIAYIPNPEIIDYHWVVVHWGDQPEQGGMAWGEGSTYLKTLKEATNFLDAITKEEYGDYFVTCIPTKKT